MRNPGRRGRGGKALSGQRVAKNTNLQDSNGEVVVKKIRRRRQRKKLDNDEDSEQVLDSGDMYIPVTTQSMSGTPDLLGGSDVDIDLNITSTPSSPPSPTPPESQTEANRSKTSTAIKLPKTIMAYRRRIIDEGGILPADSIEDCPSEGIFRRHGMIIQNNRNRAQEVRIIMSNQPTKIQTEAFVTDGLQGCIPIITSVERFAVNMTRHEKLVVDEISAYMRQEKTRTVRLNTDSSTDLSNLNIADLVDGKWQKDVQAVVDGSKQLYSAIKRKYVQPPRICLLHPNMDIVALSMICEMGLKLWMGPCQPDVIIGDCVWIPFNPTIKGYCGNPLCGRPIDYMTSYHRCLDCKQVIYCERNVCRLVGSHLHRTHCSHDQKQQNSYSYFTYFVLMHKIVV
jgi:hypothetical protein